MIHSIFSRRLSQRFRSIPLRVVLVVPFVVEVMAAVSLTGYFAYRHGQEAIEDLANRLMIGVSDRIELNVKAHLDAPVQVTRYNITALQTGLLEWQSPLTVERYFAEQLNQVEAEKGRLLGTFVIAEDRGLQSFEHRNSSLTHFGATSEISQIGSGNLTYPYASEQHQLRVMGTLPYGKEAAKDLGGWLQNLPAKGGWQIVPAMTDTDRPTLTAIYTQPFYDAQYVRHGLVGAAIELTHLNKRLASLNISETGQAFIVDRQGYLIASSSGDLPFYVPKRQRVEGAIAPVSQTVTPKVQRLKAIDSLDTVTRHTTEFLSTVQAQQPLRHTQQPLSFDLRGKRYFVRVSPFENDYHLDWQLVVVVPEADFSAQIERNSETMWALCIAALAGAIAIGLLTAQQIARPILRLSRASRDLMLGKLDGPIDEDSRITEISMLAHSFNEMSEHLLESFDQVKLALQESKEKFTTVFRTSPDPILITTLPEGQHVDVNDSFLRLTGYTREEVIGKTAIALGLWENLEERERFLQLIQEHNHVRNQEITTQLKSGRRVTVLISSEVIELEGQKCLLSIAKDITERKQLEEALRHSEDCLRQITDSLPVYIAYLDPEQHYQFVNRTYEERFGKPRQWFYGKHLRAVLGEAAYQTIQPYIERALEGHLTICTVEHPDADGVFRHFEVTLTPDFSAQGQVKGCHSLVIDVTQRKEAEETLRISEEQFRAAFDTAAVGMSIASPTTGQFMQVNPAYCRMLGYSDTELLQMTYRDVTHPDDLAVDLEFTRQLLARKVPYFHFEKRFVHKTGRTIWTLISVSLVCNSQQQPLFTVSSIQDITARKLAMVGAG